MRNNIINLRHNLNSVKELNKKKLSKVRESVNDIEDSQKFIEKEFEDQKEKIKNLIMDNKNHTHVKKVGHTSEFLFGIY